MSYDGTLHGTNLDITKSNYIRLMEDKYDSCKSQKEWSDFCDNEMPWVSDVLLSRHVFSALKCITGDYILDDEECTFIRDKKGMIELLESIPNRDCESFINRMIKDLKGSNYINYILSFV